MSLELRDAKVSVWIQSSGDFFNDKSGNLSAQGMAEQTFEAKKLKEVNSKIALNIVTGTLDRAEPMTDRAKPPFIDGGVKGLKLT